MKPAAIIAFLAIALTRAAFGQDQAAGTAPAFDMVAAAADIVTVDLAYRKHTRYISVAIEPDRDAAVRVLNFWLNHLSSAPTIEVSPTVGNLVRVRLDRLHISPAAWDALVADPTFPEPYYHLTTEVLDPKTKVKRKAMTDGGWTGLPNAEILRRETGTPNAIVRADWFLWHATREAQYYNLSNVGKDLDDFFVKLAIDRKTIQQINAFTGANTLISGVTARERRTARYPGPLGALWISFDPALNTAAESPFRNQRAFKHAANELIAKQANGLHRFFLSNAAGVRQDTVPDFVAKDDRGDGILRVGMSCVTCHIESGLKPIVNDQRDIPINAISEKETQDLERFYLSPAFERDFLRDQEDYEAAVAQATNGWTTSMVVKSYTAIIDRYRYTNVDLEQAAIEVGAETAVAQQQFLASHDPILVGLAKKKKIHRESWEANFQEAALLVYNQVIVKGLTP